MTSEQTFQKTIVSKDLLFLFLFIYLFIFGLFFSFTAHRHILAHGYLAKRKKDMVCFWRNEHTVNQCLSASKSMTPG